MFSTALTWSDLAFLAQGAGMTLAVTAVSVAAGTVLGIFFGMIRVELGPYWSAPLTFADRGRAFLRAAPRPEGHSARRPRSR